MAIDRSFHIRRDRLGHRADAHFGVDDGGERAGELDSLALDDAESGQIERERLGAGAKVDDPVLAVASVTAVRTFSISTALDASTVTPGSTAPDVSLTTPVMDAWAKAAAGTNVNNAMVTNAARAMRVNGSLCAWAKRHARTHDCWVTGL